MESCGAVVFSNSFFDLCLNCCIECHLDLAYSKLAFLKYSRYPDGSAKGYGGALYCFAISSCLILLEVVELSVVLISSEIFFSTQQP